MSQFKYLGSIISKDDLIIEIISSAAQIMAAVPKLSGKTRISA